MTPPSSTVRSGRWPAPSAAATGRRPATPWQARIRPPPCTSATLPGWPAASTSTARPESTASSSPSRARGIPRRCAVWRPPPGSGRRRVHRYRPLLDEGGQPPLVDLVRGRQRDVVALHDGDAAGHL